MRIWSINPSYLDAKGLVACWRESLLARKVLLGLTKRYKNHPQLNRFKQLDYKSSRWALETYLYYILNEAVKREYNFDKSKLDIKIFSELYPNTITVTKCQLEYEFLHLQRKLWDRDREQRIKNESAEWIKDGDLLLHNIKPNPIFQVIDGQIESWEKINA